MKSTEVYSIAREVLAPWCKEHGFKRTKGGMLGWYKPIGDQFIVFWFQVTQLGWLEDRGSKFTVEFQISDEPTIGTEDRDQRWRLRKFLNDEEFKQVRRIQKKVIAKINGQEPKNVISRLAYDFLNWFTENDLATYPRDVWFHYKDREDVERWAMFVKQKLPEVIQILSDRAAHTNSKSV